MTPASPGTAPFPALARSLALALAALLLAAGTAAAQGAKTGAMADGGLVLTPPAGRPAATLFDWSWTEPGDSRDGSVTLTQFTPRMTGLALGLTGGSAGLGRGSGASGSGVGLNYRPGTIAGQDIAVTVGAGFASQKAPGLGFSEPLTYNTAGFGGRVRIARISLGSAFLGTRASWAGTGPGLAGINGGYNLDLSYSFEAGSLSLQRFVGGGRDILGRGPDRSGETVALSGRYLVGPSLDMTAWLAYGAAPANRGVVQSEFDGWALLTGFHLSF